MPSPAVAATSPFTVEFAVFGDYGDDDADEAAVAGLVNGTLGPDFLVTTGDNIYGSADYATHVGAYYGAAIAAGDFFPALGNHDYWDTGGVSAYLDYFDLPGASAVSSNTSGNERYYDVVRGPVHVFVVDTEAALTIPDEMAAQQSWLQAGLAASTAPWQVVAMHHPPFSSGDHHGSYPALQWPFSAWGADAVFAGHDHIYERLEADGIPYFVSGVGGRDLHGLGPPVPESELALNSEFGSMLVRACDIGMVFEFHGVTSGLLDSSSVGSDCSFSPPPPGAIVLSPGSDVAAAIDSAGPGNTFFLEAGDFALGSIVLPAETTLLGQTDGDGASVARLSGAGGILIENASGVTVRNLEVSTGAAGCIDDPKWMPGDPPPEPVCAPFLLNSATDVTIEKVITTSADSHCIYMFGSTSVTIADSDIGTCAGMGVEIIDSQALTISRNHIHPEYPVFVCCDLADGIHARNSTDILVDENVIAYGETNVMFQSVVNATIQSNLFINPLGPFPRGQHVQIWLTGGPRSSNILIDNNYGIATNDPGAAFPEDQEDAISLGFTDGVVVSNNYMYGGTSPSGCAYIADVSANEVEFRNNIADWTGQCGIGISSGTDQVVDGNYVLNSYLDDPAAGNTAIYVWKQYPDPCGPVQVTNNVATAIRADGSHAPFWNGGGCDPVTLSGNTFGPAAVPIVEEAIAAVAPPVDPGPYASLLPRFTPQGPIVWLPLDEGSGVVAGDASGFGNDATLMGGASFVPDSADGSSHSVGLDGVDDWVDMGTVDVAGPGLTVAAWFNADSFPGSHGDARIVSKATGSNEDDHIFMLSTILQGGQVRLRGRVRVDGATTTVIAGSGDLSPGTWYHGAMSYTGSAVNLYLDGVLVGSAGLTGAVDQDPGVTVAGGAQPPGAGPQFWDGLIDDVRIYQRGLSGGQVEALASNTVPTADDGSALSTGAPVEVTLRGSDADDDDLMFSITDPPSGGTLGPIGEVDCSAVNVCTAVVTYTPDSGSTGTESFAFRVDDGLGRSGPGTVVVTIDPTSISGTVFGDTDGDGVRDVGEDGLGGVKVTLRSAGPDGVFGGGDDGFSSVVTGADGAYVFGGLDPGLHKVSVKASTVPAGLMSSTGNNPTIVDLVAEVPETVDFGYADPAVLTSISGTVFGDTDGDGVRDVGEDGLGGVKVTLRSAGPDGVFGGGDDGFSSVVTGADGQYVFGGLDPGLHKVSVKASTVPAGLVLTTGNTPTIVDLAHFQREIIDFGYADPAVLTSISGTVFGDGDGDGVRDVGEDGLGGVKVTLRSAGPDGVFGGGDDGFSSVVTGADGQYAFGGLDPGPFKVSVKASTVPAGLVLTTGNNPTIIDLAHLQREIVDFGYQ